MKTRYACAALLCFVPWIICTGCGLWDKLAAPKPSKGEIVISEELKKSQGKPEVKIYGLPEDTSSLDNGNSGKKASYEKIYSDEKVVPYNSGVIVIGDTAYEQYNYIEDVAARYARTVNNIAKRLKGTADVYNMVVPTSIGITLPDNKKDKVASSDQKLALEQIKSKMSANVKAVPLHDALMSHRTEYIYFRTDHHWTTKGAYYAYDSFCKSKKIMPNKIEDYQDVSFGGFLGSFYNDTGKLKTLKEDTLYAYYPVSNDKLVLEYTNNDGNTLSGNVLEDASGYGKGVKYSAFIDGDNPYTFIRNRSLADGSSCIIVKESFGNAIIPFLADHYQRIYVIDYRYWDGSLISFAKEKSVDDVIIINNISMTRNSYQVGKMALLVED